jgi:outer membrane protein
MNLKHGIVAAIAAAWLPFAAISQTTAPAASAPTAAAPAMVMPEAVPAKIAVIEFEEVAAATNEGQKAIADIQKKYEAQRTKLQGQELEVSSLTKQLQAAPATVTDEEKASRARTIDTKQKQFQRDADDYNTAVNGDIQEVVGKVAAKMGPVVVKYCETHGYTMLLDNTGQPQQGGLSVLWAPGTDISAEVVKAYNATTPSIAAPVPSAPSAARPRTAAPRPAPKQ